MTDDPLLGCRLKLSRPSVDKHQFVHSSAVIGDADTPREIAFTDLQISFAALWRLNLYMNYTVHESFARLFPDPPHVRARKAQDRDDALEM